MKPGRLPLAFHVLTAVALLASCDKEVAKTEVIRPVRAIVVAPEPVDVVAEFPGEVRARVESRLGFRVGGKIVSRKVDVGAMVKRGQVLMQIDPQDLKLVQDQANAALRSAESGFNLARNDLARHQELREKNFISPAVLDAKESALRAAQAALDQARAAARNQANQAGYADLIADVDGVVTAIDAEAGQVVAAGVPVLRVARQDEKEVVIAIPEGRVEALRGIGKLQAKVWAFPDRTLQAKLRELSPIADPATRTYTARVSLPDAPPEVKLGMTASVAFLVQGDASIKLPLSALSNEKGMTSVWIVENGAVKRLPVKLSRMTGNEVVVAAGLAPGQVVVTAGVNQLQPGQKVTLLAEASTSPAAGSAPAAATPSPAPKEVKAAGSGAAR